MRSWRERATHHLSVIASFLLALLVSGAFAACGGSSPEGVVTGTAYVAGVSSNGETSLVALRANDGGLLWKTPIPQDSESAVASITVTRSQIYVVSGSKPSSSDWLLMAVNPDTGKVDWSFSSRHMITG